MCTAALAILDRLDVPTVGWWLTERQFPTVPRTGAPKSWKMYVCSHRLRVGGPLMTIDNILSTCARPGETGLLQLLGPVLLSDPGQAHLYRQRRSHALHPVRPGAHTIFLRCRHFLCSFLTIKPSISWCRIRRVEASRTGRVDMWTYFTLHSASLAFYSSDIRGWMTLT